MNKIKLLWLIIKNKIIMCSIVRRIFNEAQIYKGSLKTIEKGFKPFKWFQKMYNDPTAEIMKIRVGFKNITILKFDMDKLYDICLKGDETLLHFIGSAFANFGISGGICATNGYKMLWLDTKFVFIDSKLYDKFNEENRRFFILHEIGHVDLGHTDLIKPKFNKLGKPVPVQIVNLDLEYEADAYARRFVNPCNPENASKAFSENEFVNRITKELLELQGCSGDMYQILNIAREYEITHRFAGEKLNMNDLQSYVLKNSMSLNLD